MVESFLSLHNKTILLKTLGCRLQKKIHRNLNFFEITFGKFLNMNHFGFSSAKILTIQFLGFQGRKKIL